MNKEQERNGFLAERHRLAFLLLGVVNKCELCLHKVKEGFTTKQEAKEVEHTICRLQTETMEIDNDIVEKLDKE